jgi:hypothetical protein
MKNIAATQPKNDNYSLPLFSNKNMTAKHLPLIIIAVLTFSITSCTTYYIPIDSFKQQLPSLEKSKTLKQVTTIDPWGFKSTYSIYPIDSIRCVDKNGKPFLLKNGPSLEIRFTDNNNKRNTFYFDRIYVVRDSITGYQSRILSIKKTIPLNTLKTIEIQDGQKKYSYVKE